MSPERDPDLERRPEPAAAQPAAASAGQLCDEARFEELQRRCRSKEAQLQTALKDQEALRARLAESVREIEAAEDRAALHQRECAASAALAQELTETLRVAAQARAQLAAALADTRRSAEKWREQSLRAENEKAALAEETGAAAQRRVDEAQLRRGESERAREQAQSLAQGLAAEVERLQAELSAKDEESCRARALALAATREAAEAKVESQRRLANSDVLQHEANEALDAAAEIKSQTELRLEEQRKSFAEERRALAAQAAAAVQEAAELKAELCRRVEAELAQARAQLDSERAALFATVEAEREKSRAEAKARAAAEQARLKSFAQALELVEGMRAEQSSERARILREVHAELGRAETSLGIAPACLQVPGPARAKPSRRAWVWAVAAAAAVLLCAGWLWKTLAASGRDHLLPFARPGAMAWQGDVLWVADSAAQAVHRLRLESGRLREERSCPLPGIRVTGLAAAGDFLYVADAAGNEIQKRRSDAALTLEKSWPVATQNIAALASDGVSLFAAFSGPGRIHQYALDEDLSVVGTFFGPPTPVGLAVADGWFWTADGGSRLLLRHRRDAQLSVKDVFAAPGLGPGALSGFALRGRAVWLSQEGRAFIRERPRWTLEDRMLADIPAEAPAVRESVRPAPAELPIPQAPAALAPAAPASPPPAP